MALGAQREQIGTQFLSLGLRLLAAGTILGLIGAWLAGRAMQSVLFGVPTLPIAALFGTALVMSSVTDCLPDPCASRLTSRSHGCPAHRMNSSILRSWIVKENNDRRFKICIAHAGQGAGFHRDRDFYACARYWCEYCDLQRLGRRLAPPAFVSKTE